MRGRLVWRVAEELRSLRALERNDLSDPHMDRCPQQHEVAEEEHFAPDPTLLQALAREGAAEVTQWTLALQGARAGSCSLSIPMFQSSPSTNAGTTALFRPGAPRRRRRYSRRR